MKRYDAYDAFARVYDQHWGFFAAKAYPVLEHLVLGNLPPGSAVLDLCCGPDSLPPSFRSMDSRQRVWTARKG